MTPVNLNPQKEKIGCPIHKGLWISSNITLTWMTSLSNWDGNHPVNEISVAERKFLDEEILRRKLSCGDIRSENKSI